MSSGRLVAKVKAVNQANAYAPKLYAMMAEVFRPYVGMAILKKDGSFIKAIADKLPALPTKMPEWGKLNDVMVTRHTNNPYALVWHIQGSHQDTEAGGTLYHTTTVVVGAMNGQILQELHPPTDLRSDYTPEEIEAKRDAVKAARRALDIATSALYPFGENDRA